jgi:anti-sigma regulatory factor (Ser/Thr protein kinase)
MENVDIRSLKAFPIATSIDAHIASLAIKNNDDYPGLSEQKRTDIITIVLELGTNIIKYAGSGKILLRTISINKREAIEILAVDQGPGIQNIDQAMEDHFSTGKTLGLGLGLVKRLSHQMQLSTPDGGGTRVSAVIWCDDARPESTGVAAQARQKELSAGGLKQASAQPDQALLISTLEHNRPCLHEPISGDTLLTLDQGVLAIRVVLDGTGHGRDASLISAKAAAAIRRSFKQQIDPIDAAIWNEPESSVEVIQTLMIQAFWAGHDSIQGSRGAAIGMAVIDRQRHQLHFLGLGNTRLMEMGYKGWEAISRDGQLGVTKKQPVIQRFPLHRKDLIVQTSDGVRSNAIRTLRPRRSGIQLNPEKTMTNLVAGASFADDVSLLITQCHG